MFKELPQHQAKGQQHLAKFEDDFDMIIIKDSQLSSLIKEQHFNTQPDIKQTTLTSSSNLFKSDSLSRTTDNDIILSNQNSCNEDGLKSQSEFLKNPATSLMHIKPVVVSSNKTISCDNMQQGKQSVCQEIMNNSNFDLCTQATETGKDEMISSSQVYESMVESSLQQTGKVSKEDFSMISVIGTGAIGKVLLVKKKNNSSDSLYAMKIMKKKHIRKHKQVKHTWNERLILEKINNPFVVKMRYAFQNEKNLFFVLDYCPGGELFFYINTIKRFREDIARFYSASILLAIECLHQHGILYRDLKPENILIDKDGYAVLTDFGLSRYPTEEYKTCSEIPYNAKLSNSFCGTVEFMAPEIIQKQHYGKACDWWSFGCVLYQMLTGSPPFYSQNRNEVYNKIMLGNPTYNNYLTPMAVDLISKLLTKNPESRLGSSFGASEIKEHPFFSKIDWVKMSERSLKPPYVPLLKSNIDLKHFDKNITNIPIESPPVIVDSIEGDFMHVDENDEDFKNFSFKEESWDNMIYENEKGPYSQQSLYYQNVDERNYNQQQQIYI